MIRGSLPGHWQRSHKGRMWAWAVLLVRSRLHMVVSHRAPANLVQRGWVLRTALLRDTRGDTPMDCAVWGTTFGCDDDGQLTLAQVTHFIDLKYLPEKVGLSAVAWRLRRGSFPL